MKNWLNREAETDYISGPHDYGTHFWCGIVAGAVGGLWIGSEIFDSCWMILLASVGAAIVCGLVAGRWGDQFWSELPELLFWW